MNLSSFSKVLVTTLLVASSSLAFAKMGYKGENFKGEAPCPPPVMLHDGFYVGAQVGYEAFRVRRNVFLNVRPRVTVFEADPALNASGWLGGLFVGYGRYLCDLYYLGAEVYGNWSGARAHWHAHVFNPNLLFDTDFRVRGSWGINLVPGIRLNDTSLGYFKIGYNWARFDFDRDHNNFVFNNFNNFNNDDDGSSGNRSRNGWSLGLGIETLLWENWSVRTEYDHIWFRNRNNNHDDDVFVNNGNRFNAQDNQFLVGLVYHFC